MTNKISVSGEKRMRMVICDLPGRLGEICRGERISRRERRRYLDLWLSDGTLTADPDVSTQESVRENTQKDSPVRTGPMQRAERKPLALGPGVHLKARLAELGLKPAAGCHCEARVRQMNAWGAEGCKEHRAEIISWLKTEATRASWGKKIAAGLTAIVSGAPLSIEGLVDEAIRRAEVEHRETCS